MMSNNMKNQQIRLSKYKIIIISIFFLQHAINKPIQAEPITNQKLESKIHYTNIDILNCNKNKIIITSTCINRNKENSAPYCFSQSVAFFNKNKSLSRIQNYKYNQESHSFIYQASCIRARNKFYIKLINSNLGNCSNCEWYDFFSNNGIYIGSSPWLNSVSEDFHRVALTKRNEITFLKAISIHSIDLSTTTRQSKSTN
jgi:hypothetical protein